MTPIIFATGYKDFEDKILKFLNKGFQHEEYVSVFSATHLDNLLDVCMRQKPKVLVLRESLAGKDFDLLSLLRQIKVEVPGIQIVVITKDRKPGDPFLTALIIYQIFDFISGEAIYVSDVAKMILSPRTFKDVDDYIPNVSLEQNSNKFSFETKEISGAVGAAEELEDIDSVTSTKSEVRKGEHGTSAGGDLDEIDENGYGQKETLFDNSNPTSAKGTPLLNIGAKLSYTPLFGSRKQNTEIEIEEDDEPEEDSEEMHNDFMLNELDSPEFDLDELLGTPEEKEAESTAPDDEAEAVIEDDSDDLPDLINTEEDSKEEPESNPEPVLNEKADEEPEEIPEELLEEESEEVLSDDDLDDEFADEENTDDDLDDSDGEIEDDEFVPGYEAILNAPRKVDQDLTTRLKVVQDAAEEDEDILDDGDLLDDDDADDLEEEDDLPDFSVPAPEMDMQTENNPEQVQNEINVKSEADNGFALYDTDDLKQQIELYKGIMNKALARFEEDADEKSPKMFLSAMAKYTDALTELRSRGDTEAAEQMALPIDFEEAAEEFVMEEPAEESVSAESVDSDVIEEPVSEEAVSEETEIPHSETAEEIVEDSTSEPENTEEIPADSSPAKAAVQEVASEPEEAPKKPRKDPITLDNLEINTPHRIIAFVREFMSQDSIALNMAIAMARKGKRVAFVDLNMPTPYDGFFKQNAEGELTLARSDFDLKNLVIVSVEKGKVKEKIKEIKDDSYDYILIDGNTIAAIEDAEIILLDVTQDRFNLEFFRQSSAGVLDGKRIVYLFGNFIPAAGVSTKNIAKVCGIPGTVIKLTDTKGFNGSAYSNKTAYMAKENSKDAELYLSELFRFFTRSKAYTPANKEA